MERKEGKILDCIEIILADKIVWSADKGIPPSPFLPRVLIVPRQICPLIIHPHSPGVSAAVPISRTVSIIVRKLKLVSNLYAHDFGYRFILQLIRETLMRAEKKHGKEIRHNSLARMGCEPLWSDLHCITQFKCAVN